MLELTSLSIEPSSSSLFKTRIELELSLINFSRHDLLSKNLAQLNSVTPLLLAYWLVIMLLFEWR